VDCDGRHFALVDPPRVNPPGSPPQKETVERDGFSALTAVYVSISILIAIFAVVTQLLAATSATSLSTTQQLAMWLVAAGLIALLSIAYMTCRTYLTARTEKAEAEQARQRLSEALAVQALADQKAKDAQGQLAQAQKEAEQARAAAVEADKRRDKALAAQATAEGEAEGAQEQLAQAQKEAEQARAAELKANEQRDEAKVAQAVAEQKLKDAQEQPAHVPPDAGLPRNPAGGSDPFSPRQSPDGSTGVDEDAWVPPVGLRHLDGSARHAEAKEVFPDGFILVRDSFSLIRDQLTREPMARYTVVDPNPSLDPRAHETVVNIPADNKPDTRDWPRYAVVKFDDLQVIPYETEQDVTRGRMEYTLRAERIQLAGQP
jgi:hypothetical protein